jgi:hypothetical protein
VLPGNLATARPLRGPATELVLGVDVGVGIEVVGFEAEAAWPARTESDKAHRALINELRAQLGEARQSVEALQKPMLMARDRFQPCEDGQLKNLLETLGSAARSLSRLVKADMVMSKSEFKACMRGKMFTIDIEDHVWNNSQIRKDLVLGGIWWAVYVTFFTNPFQVYGEVGATAVTALQAFFGQGELDLGGV